MATALLLVDIQNDFLPTGSLPVPGGDEIIPVVKDLMSHMEHIVAVQDWHPADHMSFASMHSGSVPGDLINLDGASQILWPDHCVQNTPGAQWAAGIDTSKFQKLLNKGTHQRVDSYSGFFDNLRKKSTGLANYLRDFDLMHLVICGLATDYCVKETVLDALELGFSVTVVTDGCRGVELHAGDIEKAFAEMQGLGAKFTTSSEIIEGVI